MCQALTQGGALNRGWPTGRFPVAFGNFAEGTVAPNRGVDDVAGRGAHDTRAGAHTICAQAERDREARRSSDALTNCETGARCVAKGPNRHGARQHRRSGVRAATYRVLGRRAMVRNCSTKTTTPRRSRSERPRPRPPPRSRSTSTTGRPLAAIFGSSGAAARRSYARRKCR